VVPQPKLLSQTAVCVLGSLRGGRGVLAKARGVERLLPKDGGDEFSETNWEKKAGV